MTALAGGSAPEWGLGPLMWSLSTLASSSPEKAGAPSQAT